MAPVIQFFESEPRSVKRGESASLRWNVKNASYVHITPYVGNVSTDGNRSVSPSTTTTYTLSARTDSSSVDDETASVVVNVVAPMLPPPELFVEVLRTTLHPEIALRCQQLYIDGHYD